MRFLLTLPLLVVLVAAYPHKKDEGKEDEKIVFNNDYYPEDLVIYEGKHDIIDIAVPLNRVSMYDSQEGTSSEISNIKKNLMIFFVEADMKDDYRENSGIYLYRDGKVTKVLDKGRAVAAAADDSEYVYFGAEDGLYIYDPVKHKADKYGTFSKSVKDLAKEQNSDAIYVLTDDRELYKVYDAGTKEYKVDDIKDAEQIMFDYSNNLYYYGKDKKPYVRTANGETKKIENLPEEAKEVKMFRPAMYNNDGVGLMVGTEMYNVYPDGTSEPENLEFLPETKPTAYSMEAGVFRYFGYNKKIYEYDFLSMIDSSESVPDDAE